MISSAHVFLKDRKFGNCTMPSALYKAVHLPAVLPVFFCVVFSSLGETSGDEVPHGNIRAAVGEQRWHVMARELHRDVKTLRDEQFNREFRETANVTSLDGVRINTPLLKPSDGCLSRNFSSERCLARIYSVLTWYKEHLSYIERQNLTQSLVNDVKHGTKRLLESINYQLQIDTQVEEISSSPLRAKSAWTRKTAAHSILFNFTSVMIDACRAINYMSKRKTGHNHQTKDRIKTIEWISDKH